MFAVSLLSHSSKVSEEEEEKHRMRVSISGMYIMTSNTPHPVLFVLHQSCFSLASWGLNYRC
jgi:hypothetical protein